MENESESENKLNIHLIFTVVFRAHFQMRVCPNDKIKDFV